ncbi:hypothetical protein A3L04_09655 [Thermococcus chitonophagus]|uniref:Uncharacterized protein n=1 Tax=Thermococcus chitonophagus TaxID=54262 RepID=A0A160VSF7_9EURY|nr:hypothetical protein [Thermococcus chitonophagus]ASJ17314.1 hypothetical protein A3L04_09655 [Thermococcus chitonophagus]CUX77945.1 hypothetical protein CHITON_1166 [Thermococcus chitonophagus]
MIPEEAVIHVEPKKILSYMGELATNEEEYRRLVNSPKERIKEKLGIEIQDNITIRRDYSPLSKEDIELLKELVTKDLNGNLPPEVLDFASNRLAVVFVTAIAVAVVAVKVKVYV